MLAKACGKADFVPQDVTALDYTPAMFSTKLTGFGRAIGNISAHGWSRADCP